jgi:class 3 adenylate cyclase
MDYTIIGNMVNMTARLQSHAEVDSILMGHETYSLVGDVVATEEQSPIKVKGFADVRPPSRLSPVVGPVGASSLFRPLMTIHPGGGLRPSFC